MKTQIKINAVMKQLILDFNVGSVSTVNDDGTPAVSPKGTFVIVDDQTIAYGDIRSPATRANIQTRPDVEVLFTDVLVRRALRIRGKADIVTKDSEQGEILLRHFQKYWEPYIEHMSCFVQIAISQAELVLTPAYDLGFVKDELVKTNLEKLQRIAKQ